MLEIIPLWETISTFLGHGFAAIWYILAATGTLSFAANILTQLKQITGKNSLTSLLQTILKSTKEPLFKNIQQLKDLIKLLTEQIKRKAALYTKTNTKRSSRKTTIKTKWIKKHATSSVGILKKSKTNALRSIIKKDITKTFLTKNKVKQLTAIKSVVSMKNLATTFFSPISDKAVNSAKGSIIAKHAAKMAQKSINVTVK